MTVERIFLGRPIRAEVTSLDEGVNVLLTGGELSHIGSVSVARPGEEVRTLTFLEHRERSVSEQWASVLARQMGAPAAVTCGIHYDGLTREDLGRVLELLDEMLESVMIELLKKEGL